ncbi:MAG: hypothetical protein LBR53_01445 [Deltaproteobacteria bacterium]|jgi:hypothetical protein|nr:hypothetical protein [Deltaproteobacteria bacterium]
MKIFHPLAVSALFFTLQAPLIVISEARAYGCECGVLGSLLNSHAERVINGVRPPLENIARESARYAATHFREDLTALRESVNLLRDSLLSALEAQDHNQAARLTERTYEAESQPATICGNDVLGAGMQLGAKNLDRAGLDLLTKILERPRKFERPLDYVAETAGDDWPGAFEAAELGLTNGARTYSLEESARAEKIVESLTNPLPLPLLSPDKAESPAGKNYQAMRKDYELRLSVYQGVLARTVADRAPTVEGLEEWARDKWIGMGGEGDPPGLVEGRLSRESLLWLLTNTRLSSANWFEEELPALPEAGLLRELASMAAVSLELQREQNERLRDIGALLALNGADRLNQERREAVLRQFSLASPAAK